MLNSKLVSLVCTSTAAMCFLLLLCDSVVYEGKLYLAFVGVMFLIIGIMINLIDLLNNKDHDHA